MERYPNRASRPESAAVASTHSTLRFRVWNQVCSIRASRLEPFGRLRSRASLSSLERDWLLSILGEEQEET